MRYAQFTKCWTLSTRLLVILGLNPGIKPRASKHTAELILAHLQYSAEININRSNCSGYWAGGQIPRQRFPSGGGGCKGVFWESMASFQSCQSSTSQSIMEKASDSFSPRRHSELKHEIRDYSSFKEKYIQ